ncbi:MAG: DUF2383 domain-containing protein [Syntrophotaleaceae bacterium]
MDQKKMQKEIEDLIQLDIDAIHSYEQTIEKIEIIEVRRQLLSFKQEHERHVRDLSPKLAALGGKVPRSPDLKGYLIEGFTSLRSSTGTKGALKAMQSNEKLTNRKYEEAVKKDFPADIRGIIENNRLEEAKHLRYIEEALSQKMWETKQPTRRTDMHDQLFNTLKTDHEEVKKIFTRIQETESGSERKNLVETLRKEILPHMIGEEKIIYASLKEQKDAWSDALESIEEHHAAQIVLQELVHLSPDDEHFRAKASVLKEMVEHHIKEEEETIFEDLRQVLSDKRAKEILDGFNREKEMAKSNYPDIPFVTMQPPGVRA